MNKSIIPQPYRTTPTPTNITTKLLTRPISTTSPSSHTPSSTEHAHYRALLLNQYKSTSTNPHKLLRTEINSSYSLNDRINPVYDLSYSPVVGRDGVRVLAVGDEQGCLSVVKVGYGDGRRGRVRKRGRCVVECSSSGVWNMGVTKLNPSQPLSEEEDSPQIQPVLYTLDWNSTGDRILTGYGDGSIRIWDLGGGGKDGSCVGLMQAYQKSIKRVVWGSEATIISCSRTNEIRIHDNRMRNPLVNLINCSSLNSKLTDITTLHSSHYIASCSSNQPTVNIWDLRYTYKLYKKIKPVASFNCGSAGNVCFGMDKQVDDGAVYCLGADGVIVRVGWKDEDKSGKGLSSNVFRGWRVPGPVDYFSRIDVDGGVMVSGGCGDSAFGFDLENADKPLFELREGRGYQVVGDGDGGEEIVDDDDKENGGGVVNGNMVAVENNRRCCSAVAIGTRRGAGDCFVQIATGGDDSYVTVWD